MISKGQKINDRYEIIKNIGEGGMANVFLAMDTILNREVAIKVLRGDLAGDEKFVRRFQREALSASSLDHLNIVKMYDVGEDDGNYYIVMEYIDGVNLKKLIKKRGSLAVPEAVDILLQLTAGIGHAHDAYIIHRDIKPQNIIIVDDGLVKITDFGVALAMNSTQLTQTNSVLGSVHYIPPEQASGKGSTIKSDIYSLGILFYELLTGKIPFKGEIALKQLREEIPSVRNVNPKIPQSIENIILKATAKNPKNRYKDAHQMHEDLKTALDEERKNESKVEFVYPEFDHVDEIEEKTKPKHNKKKSKKGKVKKVKIKSKNDPEEEIAKQVKNESNDKLNKIILTLGIIFAVLMIGTTALFLFVPKLTKEKEIEVPDVTSMTIKEAETTLKDAGFTINEEYLEIYDEEIEKDTIVKTMPSEGLYRKAGTTITLYISLGTKKITIENYEGLDYLEVKANLEKEGLIVVIEKVPTEEPEIETAVIDQEPEEGVNLNEGDQITLYIPEIITTYPDMVAEGWITSDVEAFATQYNLSLTISYETSATVPVGQVISQSRTAKTVIVEGTTLNVIISKAGDENDV